MKTGIELITEERKEQLEKHGFSLPHDLAANQNGELSQAARALLKEDFHGADMPAHWDDQWVYKMISKPYSERLIIAGALIAAEIDRFKAEKE